jgi:hypothetical protein
MDYEEIMAAADRLRQQKQDYDYQYRCLQQGRDQALLADAFLYLTEKFKGPIPCRVEVTMETEG